MKQNAKIYLPWGVSTLRCHLSFCCVQDCCPLCSHLLQGNWLPIRFVLHAIGMHILLSRQSTYFPASMCLRRCVDGLWLGVLSLVALQEAEPGKSCVNMNSVKDWKNYNASFDAAQTKKTNIVRWAITSGSGDQAIDLVGHEDAGCKSQWLLLINLMIAKSSFYIGEHKPISCWSIFVAQNYRPLVSERRFRKKKKKFVRAFLSFVTRRREKWTIFFSLRMGLTMARIL